jgi:hypothetical protein
MDKLYDDLTRLIYKEILNNNGFMDLVRLYDAVNKTEKVKIWMFIQNYDLRKLYMLINLECILEMSDRLNFNMLHQFKNQLHIVFSPNYEYEIMNRILKENGEQELVQLSPTYFQIQNEIKLFETNLIRQAFDRMSFKDFKKFTSIHLPDFIEPWIRQDDPAIHEFQLCLRKKLRYLKIKFDIDVLSNPLLR